MACPPVLRKRPDSPRANYEQRSANVRIGKGCHGQGGYSTYIGNPFSNNLVNLDNESDQLDWKKVSMKTLEGGEEAFGERGKIYGND